jgi:hypothetical protein
MEKIAQKYADICGAHIPLSLLSTERKGENNHHPMCNFAKKKLHIVLSNCNNTQKEKVDERRFPELVHCPTAPE